MNSSPLVTVVTPSYNQAQFLEETILSVLNQDYPHIEYIIIDGGSTDASVDIIKKYEHKLNYWVSEPDAGQSHAINKGWQMANGQIWCWLNSDDFFAHHQVVTEVVRTFYSAPFVGLIYGNCEVVDQNSQSIRLFEAQDFELKDLLRNNFGVYLMQPASFFNAKYVKEIGFLRQDFHYSMDFEFIARLVSASASVRINSTLAKYRVHAQAKSIAFGKKQMKESLKIRWKYDKFAFFIHLYRYLKLVVLFAMPVGLQKKLKPKLF